MVANRVLLDTHVAYWAITSPKRLGGKARRLIELAEVVCVSAISIAEIRIKQMSGKLAAAHDYAKAFQESGFKIADFDVESADAISRFGSLANHDPFDRLILGQASATATHFITADRTILALNPAFVIDAEL